MDFTSQICTTEEQSKRLLTLGLNAKTADMCYQVKFFDPFPHRLVNCAPLLLPHPPLDNERFIPAWSLHRLIEMMPPWIDTAEMSLKLTIVQGKLVYYQRIPDETQTFIFGYKSLYDSIISVIEKLIKEGYFNKEYLEGK